MLSSVNAQTQINEIGINQTPQFIELVNSSSESADISLWYLDDSGGSTYFTIPAETVISPLSCMVFSYDFNLNKSSPDAVRLFNTTAPPTSSSAVLIDSFAYKQNPGESVSFVRLPDGENNWTTAASSFGKWNTSQTNCIITMIPTPIPAEYEDHQEEPTLTPILASPTLPFNYNTIMLSEVMVYPDKESAEWFELYNNNNFEVYLSQWFIDDRENEGSPPKLFSAYLRPYQYTTVNLTSYVFNNDSDTVRLLDAQKNEVASFEYSKAQQGKSYGKVFSEFDTYCIQNASKNSANNPCIFSLSPSPIFSTIQSSSAYFLSIPTLTVSPFKKIFVAENFSSNENVLGVTLPETELENTTNHYWFYSFLSLTYSLLTIISTFIKMRNAG